MAKTKDNRKFNGGARTGSGPKQKYICKLKAISIKIPEDYIDIIRQRIKDEILVDYLTSPSLSNSHPRQHPKTSNKS
jgi:hypothetical protein